MLEKLGGRTRARTWDPLTKSFVLRQVHQGFGCKFYGFEPQEDQYVTTLGGEDFPEHQSATSNYVSENAGMSSD
jgi:hypothetical protein